MSSAPKRKRFVGLKNSGATCYLNSLLQTMYITPELRRGLFKLKGRELGVQSFDDSEEEGGVSRSKARVIPIELQELFATLQSERKASSVPTKDLTKSFGWSGSDLRQQHDLSELNTILMEALDLSLKKTSGENLIRDTYQLRQTSQIHCKSCGYNSSPVDSKHRSLLVMVKGNKNLEESIGKTLATEILDGYRCTACNQKVKADRKHWLTELPPILTIYMLRFEYDFTADKRVKLDDRFEFPLEMRIKITPGASKGDFTPSEEIYDLFSVVIHSGTALSGHYHAYIRDLHYEVEHSQPNGTWDTKGSSQSASKSARATSPRKSSRSPSANRERKVTLDDALVLMFKAVDKGCNLNGLGNRFKHVNGNVAWSKTFGKTFGKVKDFLRQYSEYFEVKRGGNVLLRGDRDLLIAKVNSLRKDQENEEEEEKKQMQAKEEQEKKQEAKKVEEIKKGSQSSVSNREKESFLPKYGGWFDFNDSKVSPISVTALRSQFGGSNPSSSGRKGRSRKGKSSGECAYILFYRKRKEVRSEVGKIVTAPPPLPSLPDWVLAREKAKAEAKQRLTISITVLPQLSTEEALDISKKSKYCSKGNPPPRWSCVKAKKNHTMDEFLSLLKEVMGIDFRKLDDIALYRQVKSKVQTVVIGSEAATEKTMTEYGLQDGDEVFLFQRIGSVQKAALRESEKIVISAEQKRRNGKCYEILVKDDITNSTLKFHLESGVELGDLRRSLEIGGCFPPPKTSEKSTLSHRMETVDQVTLLDATKIEEVDLKRTKYTLLRVARPQPSAKQISLRVQYRDDDESLHHLLIERKDSVAQLKTKIVELLGKSKEQENGGLFGLVLPHSNEPIAKDGSKASTHLKMKVNDLKLCQGSVISLVPVDPDEIKVSLRLFIPNSSDFFDTRKTGKEGKNDGKRMNLDTPEKVKPEDTPPVSPVKKAMDYLTGIFSALSLSPNSGDKEKEDASMRVENEWGEAARPLEGNWIELGDVEIRNKNTPNDELRMMALSLIENRLKEDSKVVPPPTLRHVRLVILGPENIPMRVLRSGSAPLEASSNSNVGVFITPIPDPEGKHWRVVHLRYFDSKKRLYGPANEMIVEKTYSHLDSINAFRLRINQRKKFGGILADKMRLAFYRPEIYRWKELKGSSGWQSGSKRRRKKKKKKKKNRKHKGPCEELINNRDHTVIGVLDSTLVETKKVNFQTEIDEAKESALLTAAKASQGDSSAVRIVVDLSSDDDSESDD